MGIEPLQSAAQPLLYFGAFTSGPANAATALLGRSLASLLLLSEGFDI
jgi:hypothetical protein